MSELRDSLRSSVAASTAPYGYTLTVWASGATAISLLGTPDLLDVLLLMAGAVCAFVSIEALAYGSSGLAHPGRPAPGGDGLGKRPLDLLRAGDRRGLGIGPPRARPGRMGTERPTGDSRSTCLSTRRRSRSPATRPDGRGRAPPGDGVARPALARTDPGTRCSADRRPRVGPVDAEHQARIRSRLGDLSTDCDRRVRDRHRHAESSFSRWVPAARGRAGARRRRGWSSGTPFGLACVAAVLVWSPFAAETPIDRLAAHPGLRLKVIAAQWSWRFVYSNGVQVADIDTWHPAPAYVPTGTEVEFSGTSEDVIHGFWIPGPALPAPGTSRLHHPLRPHLRKRRPLHRRVLRPLR